MRGILSGKLLRQLGLCLSGFSWFSSVSPTVFLLETICVVETIETI